MDVGSPQIERLEKIAAMLAIKWSDGREDFLPLSEVRRACPCAVCCGEPDLRGKLAVAPSENPATASTDLLGWDWVGGYGFQPRWGDGHRTGIYTLTLLRQLGSIHAG